MGLGGVERSFINLSKEFRSEGHNVKFVSSCPLNLPLIIKSELACTVTLNTGSIFKFDDKYISDGILTYPKNLGPLNENLLSGSLSF